MGGEGGPASGWASSSSSEGCVLLPPPFPSEVRLLKGPLSQEVRLLINSLPTECNRLPFPSPALLDSQKQNQDVSPCLGINMASIVRPMDEWSDSTPAVGSPVSSSGCLVSKKSQERCGKKLPSCCRIGVPGFGGKLTCGDSIGVYQMLQSVASGALRVESLGPSVVA